MSVEDCFNASDAMVSDVSAVVSDYLHSGKPFAMVSVGRTPEQLLVDAGRQSRVRRAGRSSNLVGGMTTCLEPIRSPPCGTRPRSSHLGDFPDENYAEGSLWLRAR